MTPEDLGQIRAIVTESEARRGASLERAVTESEARMSARLTGRDCAAELHK